MKEKYVVIKSYSFDPEIVAVEFDSYEKAKAYLYWNWEEYLNEEIANESDLNMDLCFHEDEFALIAWEDCCQTEWRLATVNKVDEKFNEVDWKRYL